MRLSAFCWELESSVRSSCTIFLRFAIFRAMNMRDRKPVRESQVRVRINVLELVLCMQRSARSDPMVSFRLSSVCLAVPWESASWIRRSWTTFSRFAICSSASAWVLEKRSEAADRRTRMLMLCTKGLDCLFESIFFSLHMPNFKLLL